MENLRHIYLTWVIEMDDPFIKMNVIEPISDVNASFEIKCLNF